MQVIFYETTSENITVNKTLKNAITLDCRLKDPCDVLNPVLNVANKKVLKRNYMYIPDLGRYYFIDKMKMLTGNILQITGKVDVLMSYKDDLLSRTAFVLRQENIYNVNFNDSMLPIRSDTNYKVYNLGEVPSDYQFYITTNGGVN